MGSTHTMISVQITGQSDVHLSAAIYAGGAGTGPIPGVERGYVDPSNTAQGNGLVMLVTGGKGVLITLHQPQPFSGARELALAAAVAAKL